MKHYRLLWAKVNMNICFETIQIFYTITEDNTCCVPCQNSNGSILFLYGGNFPQTALASDTACDQERRLRNDHIMSPETSIQP